jgi:hypothetical protein
MATGYLSVTFITVDDKAEERIEWGEFEDYIENKD